MNSSISGSIEDKIHRLPVRVYYSDTDAGGVIYHSRYLDMAEHGRSDMFRTCGGNQFETMKSDGIGFVIRSLEIAYHSPGFLDDLLTVETRVVKAERFTVIFNQKVMREDQCLAELKVKAACVSLKSGRPTPMPEEWKTAIDRILAC